MDDLRARFQTLDQVEVPDLWSDIASRTTSQTTAVQRARNERPVTSGKRVNAWLVAIIAMAAILVLALGGVFVGSRLNPIDSTPSPGLTQPPAGNTPYGLLYMLDGELFIADWDGANPTMIAENGSKGECPIFVEPGRDNGIVSPDGQYLAFRSRWWESGCAEINITDLEGRPVTSFPGFGWKVAWSPDSTRIATWLSESDFVSDFGRTIGVYGLDGMLQVEVDGSPMGNGDYDPVFSPDGAASILVRDNGGPWELPLDGGMPRRVPAGDPRSTMRYLEPLAYSPDKSRVAFLAPSDLDGEFVVLGELVVADPDGAEREVLIERDLKHRLSAPIWSPVDERIVFRDENVTLLTYQNDSVVVHSIDIRVVDRRSGVVTTLLTRESGVLEPAYALEPLGFSPDGERILVLDETGDLSSLWSVATDGSGAQLLLEGTTVGAWVTMPANPGIQ